jgi:hypothetical protein
MSDPRIWTASRSVYLTPYLRRYRASVIGYSKANSKRIALENKATLEPALLALILTALTEQVKETGEV